LELREQFEKQMKLSVNSSTNTSLKLFCPRTNVIAVMKLGWAFNGFCSQNSVPFLSEFNQGVGNLWRIILSMNKSCIVITQQIREAIPRFAFW